MVIDEFEKVQEIQKEYLDFCGIEVEYKDTINDLSEFDSPALFVATHSLSECPLEVREEVKEILIGVNMKTMLLDNYTQFGTNGSNNIFSVDNYEVNATLDTELFNINAQEFLGFYRL